VLALQVRSKKHSGPRRLLSNAFFAARNLVKEGELTSAEQVIGKVGRSGRSTGTRLNFKLQKSGEYIDLRKFLLANGRLSTG